MKHADDMAAQGFIIDSTCYPWIAYKGPRFQPTEHHQCYTELESKLLRQLEGRAEARRSVPSRSPYEPVGLPRLHALADEQAREVALRFRRHS